VIDELQHGGYIVTKPAKLRPRTGDQNVSVPLSRELRSIIEEGADDSGRTLAAQVRFLLTLAIAQQRSSTA
jgi:hypothetical protein